MASRVEQYPPSRVRLRLGGPGTQRNGAPLEVAERRIPAQVQVNDRCSRPGRRLVVLDALHHENHAARLDGCAVLMSPQQRARQEIGVEPRQFLVIPAIQGNGRDPE